MVDPVPAATLVLMRQSAGAAEPELLMVERAGSMAFAAGAMVFPGGRLDPGDHDLAADHVARGWRGDPEEGAARVAAIRETVEEVGVAIAIDPLPTAEALAAMRAALAGGADFGTLLRDAGHKLDLDRLIPFARWRPNFRESRVFDTRFYLAAAARDTVAEADGGESVHAIWASASAILADADAGRHRIIFPTRRNLERLARLASFDDACRHAASFPVETVVPWIEERADGRWLCIPDYLGYPVTAESMATVVRGVSGD